MKPLATFANRLAFLQSSAWLPPALLLLALSAVFIFGGDRARFYKDLNSIGHSAKVLAIADNLSPEHRFRMFVRQILGSNQPIYTPYNRFPIGGFALIKLTILPFGNDLSAKIYPARMLMLLFFAASAILAYLSLSRIAANRWIALTAVLLAFSSAYALYFSDVIFNEGVIDLFAVILVFHALVIFEQDGRFRQLLLKTCAALLLGWHVYGLLLPFIAFGLIRQLIKAWSSDSPASGAVYRLKHAALSLIRSRYMTLGVVALLFGVSILAFNFTNEYFALNREKPLTELPSFKSLSERTSVNPHLIETHGSAEYLSWPNFVARQFYRIGMMSLPRIISPSYTDLALSYVKHREALPLPLVILGIAAFGASLIGLRFIRRHKILLASLTLSGFCWALPMRAQTAFPWHHHEGIFYIGVALTLFALMLICIRRLSSERIVAALALAALPVFALSAFLMAQIDHPNRTSEFHKVAIADFENIRNMIDIGNSVWLHSLKLYHDRRIADYYLTRRVVVEPNPARRYMVAPIDFVVTDTRAHGLASLTPQNQMLFLYKWDDFKKRIDQVIEQARQPLFRSDFNVYQDGGTLIYVKDDCSEDDIANKFFLAVHPENESDLPDDRRQYGYDDLSFQFRERAVRRDEQCIAIAAIPDYDVDYIHTGQYIDQADGSFDYTWGWLGKIHKRVPRAVWANPDQAIAQAGEPLTRSNFDIYLNDNNLIYLKDQCSADDAQPRFFLAVYPVHESALPDDRRQYGYDDLSFRFQQRASQSDERCIAITPLPDYPIDHIHTGQFTERADGSFEYTWEWLGELRIPISPDELAALDEAIAQADEPLIRAHFNVYLIHDNLIYLKDGCSEDDTLDPFFLALYPAHESNLPAGRQQYGYDNIDFYFQDQGVQRGGRCIAVTPLPDYGIARINTGQYIQRDDGSYEHTWESATALPDTAH